MKASSWISGLYCYTVLHIFWAFRLRYFTFAAPVGSRIAVGMHPMPWIFIKPINHTLCIRFHVKTQKKWHTGARLSLISRKRRSSIIPNGGAIPLGLSCSIREVKLLLAEFWRRITSLSLLYIGLPVQKQNKLKRVEKRATLWASPEDR